MTISAGLSTLGAAIANASQSLFDLIRQSLPSDEVRLARFKARAPAKYLKIRKRMEDSMYETIRWEMRNSKIDYGAIVSYVQDEAGDLAPSEESSLIDVLCRRFGVGKPIAQ